MKILISVIVLCAIQVATSVSDPNYRLNSPIRPKSYAISITPYFDTGDERSFTFDGEVKIVLTTEELNINQIKIHAQDLKINATDILVTSAKNALNLNPVDPIVFNEKYSFLYINLETTLEPAVEYTLQISYSGPLRDDMSGFYRAWYMENGVKKWLGVTQFESTNARKAFPCFDEPSYKATFAMTINRPANFSESLSNMKMVGATVRQDGYIQEVFHPTPVMPTYLLAFLVSEYELGAYSNDSGEVGVYSRPQAKNQTNFSLDFAKKVVHAFGDYFGIDYYSTNEFLNLNHVGITQFNAGAMENWGLITYREEYILFDEAESDPSFLNQISTIITHETTHQWFGNLVTCHWWSDIWLNEAFANYFENFITEQIDQELGADVSKFQYAVRAYVADEDEDAPPISNKDVNSPSEISKHFGTITYQKGGAILSMVSHLIGGDAFRYGLQAYLNANNFSVGYPEKLYEALSDGVGNSSLVNITEFMDAWISKPGHPVLHVELEQGGISLKQERFFRKAELKSEQLYPIPLTYTTSISPNFNKTTPEIVMSSRTLKLKIEYIDGDEWVIFNLKESGFYRVNYSKDLWAAIANALKSNRTTIHPLNRAKIIDDLFAFLKADDIDFGTILNLLEFLHDENEHVVWNKAVSDLKYLLNSYNDEDIVQAYVLSLLENIVGKVGFTVSDAEGLSSLLLRKEVLALACRVHHQGCVEHAVSALQELRENGVPVEPSLRSVVYCYGIMHGSADDFKFLQDKLETTNVATEAVIIREALGCSSDDSLLREYLMSSADSDSILSASYATVPWSSVVSRPEKVDLAIQVLGESFATLYDGASSAISKIVTSVASAVRTTEQFEKFESWLASCTLCSEDLKATAREALEDSKVEAKWAEDHYEEISKLLKNSAIPTSPLVGLLVVTIGSLMLC